MVNISVIDISGVEVTKAVTKVEHKWSSGDAC